MGFHSLPIEGDPAENSRKVLDQIESGLVELHADNVERVGNRITFSAGIFSFKRWVGPHPLAFVTSGEIEIEPSGDVLMVDYRLRFYQLFIVYAVMILCAGANRQFRVANLSLTAKLTMMALCWLLGVAGSVVGAMSRFSKFLRQFPRKD
jgi:hypothetical protein